MLTGSAIRGTGNDLNNMLTGNSENNTLQGGAGDDILDGGSGSDLLMGGAGSDTYYVDDDFDVVMDMGARRTMSTRSCLPSTTPLAPTSKT